MTGNTSPPPHHSVSQDERTRANLLLLVIALGWSIYAVFSMAWNNYWLIGSINIVEVVASLGLRYWLLKTQTAFRYTIACHLAAAINVVGILLVTLLMGQANSFVPWYLALIPLAVSYIGRDRKSVV
mgnify:FL=1